MIEMKIEGLDELRAKLMQLPRDLHQRELRLAVSAAARVVRDEARRNVPLLSTPTKNRKPGTLRNAIRVGRSKQNSSSVQETHNVFVKTLNSKQRRRFKVASGGKAGRENPDDPFYWVVWEFGNGVNNSRPFLRPAFDTKSREALETMRKALARGLERTAKKLGLQFK